MKFGNVNYRTENNTKLFTWVLKTITLLSCKNCTHRSDPFILKVVSGKYNKSVSFSQRGLAFDLTVSRIFPPEENNFFQRLSRKIQRYRTCLIYWDLHLKNIFENVRNWINYRFVMVHPPIAVIYFMYLSYFRRESLKLFEKRLRKILF